MNWGRKRGRSGCESQDSKRNASKDTKNKAVGDIRGSIWGWACGTCDCSQKAGTSLPL